LVDSKPPASRQREGQQLESATRRITATILRDRPRWWNTFPIQREPYELAMTKQQFDEFAPLWGLESKSYVLVSVQPTCTDLQHCVILNRQSKSASLIEDPELALEVMRHMVEAGVEIVSKLPVDAA
jgi:hypothetical protein